MSPALLVVLLVLLAIALLTAIVGGVYSCMLLWSALGSDAPWVPISRRGTRDFVTFIGELPPDTRVVDLGSGDGRILHELARANPGIVGLGIEQSGTLNMYARRRARRLGLRQLEFRSANFFDESLREVDVVTSFLLPGAMAKLAPKFVAELRPGARVFAVSMPVPGWEPKRVSRAQGRETLYELVIPQKA